MGTESLFPCRRQKQLKPTLLSGRWGLVDGEWVALLAPFSEWKSEAEFYAAVSSLAGSYPEAEPLYSEERERKRRRAIGERLKQGRRKALLAEMEAQRGN